MRHLNYNHLLYFWTVAREGSIAKASVELHLTPQTISGQLKLLEEAIGEALFDRVGRGLILTHTGQQVKQYADEIFSLGAELAQRVQGGQTGKSMSFNVGIVDTIPKLVAYRMLRPVMALDSSVHMACHEGSLERLLGELALHRLDMVFSDRPLPTGLNVKAFNHRLGSSEIAFFAQRRQAAKYKRNFPQSLDRSPCLLPLAETVLRRNLEDWFEREHISPDVVAEFDDSALLKVFGEAGIGVFPAPLAIAEQVNQMYHARAIGTAHGVTETYYAISPERKLKHPAVICINNAAREQLIVRSD